MVGERRALLQNLPAPVIDTVLAAAVAGAMVLTVSVAEEEEATRSPDLPTYSRGEPPEVNARSGAQLLPRERL